MDKYELNLKIEQLNKLVRKGDYVTAAKVADQLEWKKMKQWSVMSNAIDAYIAIGKYDKARNVCVYAYNRNLGGRRLLSTLTEMYIKLGDYDEATEVYHEFVEMAPRDLSRYVLRYKLRKAQGALVGELIDILEAYKENELDEAYSYELALLYSEAGLSDRCVKECDELVLWFSEGAYVEKALRLKRMYAPLTPKQQETLARLERISALGLDYDSALRETDEDEPEEEYAGEDIEIQVGEEAQDDAVYAYNQDEHTEAYEASDEEEPESIEIEIDAEPEEEEKTQKRSNILSIIPEGFKNKVKNAFSKDIIPLFDKREEAFEDESEDTVDISLQGVMDEIIAREEQECEEIYLKEAEKQAEPEEDIEDEPVIENLENTTSWEPILPEGEAYEEEVFNAIIPEEPAEETELIQEAEPTKESEQIKALETDEEVQPVIQAAPEEIHTTQPEQAYKEIDADEIKIEIKDYSVYDTRNLQQELKASMEEIMEAVQNREAHEAELDLAAEAEYIEPSTEEPTKEIVINNHQWRKASRNHLQPAQVDKAATTVIDVAAVKAGLAVQGEPQEEIDDQIEGQMDIMQWLAELEEEEKALVAEKAGTTVEEVQEEAAEEDEAAGAEQIVEVEEAAEAEQTVEEEAADIIESTADDIIATETISSRDKERAAIREIAAAIEEAVAAGSKKKASQENIVVDEDAEKESGEAEVLETAVEALSVEEAAVTEVTATEEIPEDFIIEEEFEEIPEIDEPEEEDLSELMSEAVKEQPEEDDFPDLDEAISAGIDKMIDDTINQAVSEQDAYEDIANYVLQPEERKFLGKYLYMNGMEENLSDYIGEKRLVKSDGTSARGNAAVMGNKSTDKTAFAVNLVKAIHAFDEEREQTIARTTAENLNAKGVGMVRKKLMGGTLIIENAGKLIRERITDLISFMSSETQGTLIIIADEEFSINKIFMENPDFAEMFTGRFLLKQYSVNELVGIAKDYAQENDWKIEDKALLKLYLIFSRLHNDDQGNIVLAVKDIMDTAAENAGKHIGNRLFKKLRNTLTIKESDFEEVDEDEEE